jgi:hypothetical protein
VASRKRFNQEERALLTAAAPGLAVEWRNGSHWHPARLTSAEIATEDGWQHVTAVNLATTRTISSGEPIRVTPGAIRAPR